MCTEFWANWTTLTFSAQICSKMDFGSNNVEGDVDSQMETEMTWMEVDWSMVEVEMSMVEVDGAGCTVQQYPFF